MRFIYLRKKFHYSIGSDATKALREKAVALIMQEFWLLLIPTTTWLKKKERKKVFFCFRAKSRVYQGFRLYHGS